jgi:hypothetical protein
MAIALGLNFSVGVDPVLVLLTLSETAPAAGFYLRQTDPDPAGALNLNYSAQLGGLDEPVIPEPESIGLLGLGLVALGVLSRFRNVRQGPSHRVAILGAFALAGSDLSWSAPPVVKTAPWVATNSLIPHDTFAGKAVTLKGTSDVAGTNIQYTWDFGDGTPVQAGRVVLTPSLPTDRRPYMIEATHTYAGSAGTLFVARLTVTNTTTSESASKDYLIQMQAKSLPAEVNVAIDEGLWYLHKTMARAVAGGADVGDWQSCPIGSCVTVSGYHASTAANVHAFVAHGHREDGDPSNPYTETVGRGMKRLFQYLTSITIPAGQTNPKGTFNPDTNGNGHGVYVTQGLELYQGGMFMDAIIAPRTHNRLATTGQAASGSNEYTRECRVPCPR